MNKRRRRRDNNNKNQHPKISFLMHTILLFIMNVILLVRNLILIGIKRCLGHHDYNYQ